MDETRHPKTHREQAQDATSEPSGASFVEPFSSCVPVESSSNDPVLIEDRSVNNCVSESPRLQYYDRVYTSRRSQGLLSAAKLMKHSKLPKVVFQTRLDHPKSKQYKDSDFQRGGGYLSLYLTDDDDERDCVAGEGIPTDILNTIVPTMNDIGSMSLCNNEDHLGLNDSINENETQPEIYLDRPPDGIIKNEDNSISPTMSESLEMNSVNPTVKNIKGVSGMLHDFKDRLGLRHQSRYTHRHYNRLLNDDHITNQHITNSLSVEINDVQGIAFNHIVSSDPLDPKQTQIEMTDISSSHTQIPSIENPIISHDGYSEGILMVADNNDIVVDASIEPQLNDTLMESLSDENTSHYVLFDVIRNIRSFEWSSLRQSIPFLTLNDTTSTTSSNSQAILSQPLPQPIGRRILVETDRPASESPLPSTPITSPVVSQETQLPSNSDEPPRLLYDRFSNGLLQIRHHLHSTSQTIRQRIDTIWNGPSLPTIAAASNQTSDTEQIMIDDDPTYQQLFWCGGLVFGPMLFCIGGVLFFMTPRQLQKTRLWGLVNLFFSVLSTIGGLLYTYNEPYFNMPERVDIYGPHDHYPIQQDMPSFIFPFDSPGMIYSFSQLSQAWLKVPLRIWNFAIPETMNEWTAPEISHHMDVLSLPSFYYDRVFLTKTKAYTTDTLPFNLSEMSSGWVIGPNPSVWPITDSTLPRFEKLLNPLKGVLWSPIIKVTGRILMTIEFSWGGSPLNPLFKQSNKVLQSRINFHEMNPSLIHDDHNLPVDFLGAGLRCYSIQRFKNLKEFDKTVLDTNQPQNNSTGKILWSLLSKSKPEYVKETIHSIVSFPTSSLNRPLNKDDILEQQTKPLMPPTHTDQEPVSMILLPLQWECRVALIDTRTSPKTRLSDFNNAYYISISSVSFRALP